MYKQSIVLFGLVIPLIIIVIFVTGGMYLKKEVDTRFDSKLVHFKNYENGQIHALKIQEEIGKQKKITELWSEVLTQEAFSLVSSNLRLIGEKLPPKEFQQTSFERANNGVGFAGATAQKSSGVKFNLRGTYRSVQKALLELETRMPNLQLQDLLIAPNSNPENSSLDFQMTYTAWEK